MTNTSNALYAIPAMPEKLVASTAANLVQMETALQRLYDEDATLRQLLSTIQSGQSVTGSVGNDNGYAALKMHTYVQNLPEFSAIAGMDLKDFISLFRKARRKLGVDVSSRLKLAKASATAA